MRERSPRERGKIAPPTASSQRSPKVPPVHMASLITTAQNWPLVPNPTPLPTPREPAVSALVERAAAKGPRMSIDVELDFDDPAPPPPVVLNVAMPKLANLVVPAMPVPPRPTPSAPSIAKSTPAEPTLSEPPRETRGVMPIVVALMCIASLGGAIAIVALKLLHA